MLLYDSIMGLFRSHPHSFDHLIASWRTLAEIHDWTFDNLAGLHEEALFRVLIPGIDQANPERTCGYASASIHGDECAPAWGLLRWAEKNATALSESSGGYCLFPCLNPHGFQNNERRDETGRDRNRAFGDNETYWFPIWENEVTRYQFSTTACLHEDFDAQGCYVYELTRSDQRGDELLAAVSAAIPRDLRTIIDESVFLDGQMVEHRGATDDELREQVNERLDAGYPEAIWLYLEHQADSITFETPSEWDIEKRVEAHRLFLEHLFSSND